jgi:hypothetical protein
LFTAAAQPRALSRAEFSWRLFRWEASMRQRALAIAAVTVATFIIPAVTLAESYPEPVAHPQEYLRWFVQKCLTDNRERLKQKGGFSGEQIAAYCGCAAGSALVSALVKAKGLDPAAEVTGGTALTYCVSGLAAPGSPKIEP